MCPVQSPVSHPSQPHIQKPQHMCCRLDACNGASQSKVSSCIASVCAMQNVCLIPVHLASTVTVYLSQLFLLQDIKSTPAVCPTISVLSLQCCDAASQHLPPAAPPPPVTPHHRPRPRPPPRPLPVAAPLPLPAGERAPDAFPLALGAGAAAWASAAASVKRCS